MTHNKYLGRKAWEENPDNATHSTGEAAVLV